MRPKVPNVSFPNQLMSFPSLKVVHFRAPDLNWKNFSESPDGKSILSGQRTIGQASMKFGQKLCQN
jgi:hypothetical protein